MKITALVLVLLAAGTISASAENMYPGKVIHLDEKSEQALISLCPAQHTCTFYLNSFRGQVVYMGFNAYELSEGPYIFELVNAIEFDRPHEDVAGQGYRGQCVTAGTLAEVNKKLTSFGTNTNCKGTWPKTWVQHE